MLLQSQYNLYKKLLYFLIFLIICFTLGIVYFKVSSYFLEKKINKDILSINKLEDSISQLKNNSSYTIYLFGENIYSKDKHINYVALYKYLNQVKNLLLKDLAWYNITRFIFEVNPNQINIDTTLPTYNTIYMSGGLVDLLSKRDFVKLIKINNFRKVPSGINVKVNIDTK